MDQLSSLQARGPSAEIAAWYQSQRQHLEDEGESEGEEGAADDSMASLSLRKPSESVEKWYAGALKSVEAADSSDIDRWCASQARLLSEAAASAASQPEPRVEAQVYSYSYLLVGLAASIALFIGKL